MTEWSDHHYCQRVDSLVRLIALRHHDVGVCSSIPGLDSFNTVIPP